MKCICDPRTWERLLASDFNRGYLAALERLEELEQEPT